MAKLSKESRTAKSIKNSAVALSFFGIDFILKFLSRSIFLEILGDEVLGLNSTIMNLLQFLNLAELGIGAAVGFTLYKPILDNDTNTINEIVHLNGYLYKRVAILVGIGAFILMCFFPIIFKKIELPLWYTYATFITFLIGLILNYCMNYKQILLSASQMDYKIQYSYKTCQIIKVLIQIVAVELFTNPYIWWLLIEGLFSIISAIALNMMVEKNFAYIKHKTCPYKDLKIKYKSIIIKIKQIFFHKICGFVLTQTSPLIIYAYLSLSVVTLYMNYVLITTGITQLLNAVFNSMTNSIGNLVAENNRNHIINVFYEIFSLRFYVASICCVAVLILSKPFISLWIGNQYIIPDITLYIIVGILYISVTRTTVEAFLNAYGMYQDIWSPIIEAIINLGMSIFLGYIYGLNGILSGTLISLVIIVLLWKPYFLFRYGFQLSIYGYIYNYIKHIIILLASFSICYLINNWIGHSYNIGTLWTFMIFSLSNLLVFLILFTSLMIIFKMPIINTLKRFEK